MINIDTEEQEKFAVGSVTSFDIWKDTLILGSKYIQFMDMEKWEWKINYERIRTTHDNVRLSMHELCTLCCL